MQAYARHCALVVLLLSLVTEVYGQITTLLPGTISYAEQTWTLVLAAGYGGVIGAVQKFLIFKESVKVSGSAGIRTHALVALGACLAQLIPMWGYTDFNERISQVRVDPSRIAGQVISGLGFLGAGTIVRHGDDVIRGLTAAASLWVAGVIGLATAGGLYFASMIAVVLSVFVLVVVKMFEDWMLKRRRERKIYVTMNRDPRTMYAVANYITKHLGTILGIRTVNRKKHPGMFVSIDVRMDPELYDKLDQLIFDLSQVPGVMHATAKQAGSKVMSSDAVTALQMSEHMTELEKKDTTHLDRPRSSSNAPDAVPAGADGKEAEDEVRSREFFKQYEQDPKLHDSTVASSMAQHEAFLQETSADGGLRSTLRKPAK